MGNNLQLRVDLGGFAAAKNILHGAIIGMLSEAVADVSAQTAAMWQEEVHRARLWVGERDAYANSIAWRMTGALTAEVEATYQQAEQIENGRPARDLKRMLATSLKARVNKKGQRYLIIPFRHNTPGYTGHSTDMPEHVYKMAKRLQMSSVKGMSSRASGTGAFDIHTGKLLRVPQALYNWGGRLPPGSMGPNPKGKVDRYAGMVRMIDTAAKSGPKSTYLTFRVMKEGSPGWIIPAKAGLKIAEGVAKKMQPIAQEEFLSAVKGEV